MGEIEPPEVPRRAWLRVTFEKNRAYLEREAVALRPINWSGPAVAVGALALGFVDDAIVAFAADQQRTGEAILKNAASFVREAIQRRGATTNRDEIDLDRVRIAVANTVGRGLAPTDFASWTTPYDAFRPYVSSPSALLEEQNAARFVWATIASVERNRSEFEEALRVRLKKHAEFRKETALIPSLWDLTQDPSDPNWSSVRRVLVRWLSPKIETASYVSNFGDLVLAVLVLLWSRWRLGELSRKKILDTYCGESL